MTPAPASTDVPGIAMGGCGCLTYSPHPPIGLQRLVAEHGDRIRGADGHHQAVLQDDGGDTDLDGARGAQVGTGQRVDAAAADDGVSAKCEPPTVGVLTALAVHGE